MTDRHSEIEYKFDANSVTFQQFKNWGYDGNPYVVRTDRQHHDVYFANGENVVRHRRNGGAGELTVKKRKQASGIADRVEIDLRFKNDVTVEDVEAFLLQTGWSPVLTLTKGEVVDFKFHCVGDRGRYDVSVALYEITNDSRRFLEVEVEKHSPIGHSIALLVLEEWRDRLQTAFGLGKPLPDSLFELYTGKRYLTAIP